MGGFFEIERERERVILLLVLGLEYLNEVGQLFVLFGVHKA